MAYRVGNAVLELPPGLRAGSGVEVTLELSSEGTISLTGRELSSNREIIATFKSDCVLEEEEMLEKRQKMRNLIIE